MLSLYWLWICNHMHNTCMGDQTNDWFLCSRQFRAKERLTPTGCLANRASTNRFQITMKYSAMTIRLQHDFHPLRAKLFLPEWFGQALKADSVRHASWTIPPPMLKLRQQMGTAFISMTGDYLEMTVTFQEMTLLGCQGQTQEVLHLLETYQIPAEAPYSHPLKVNPWIARVHSSYQPSRMTEVDSVMLNCRQWMLLTGYHQ